MPGSTCFRTTYWTGLAANAKSMRLIASSPVLAETKSLPSSVNLRAVTIPGPKPKLLIEKRRLIFAPSIDRSRLQQKIGATLRLLCDLAMDACQSVATNEDNAIPAAETATMS